MYVLTIFCFQAFPSISNIVHTCFHCSWDGVYDTSVPITFLTSWGQRGRRVKMVAYLSPGKTTASQVPWRDIMMSTCTRHWLGCACLMALLLPKKLGSLSISLQRQASQNVGSKKLMQTNPSGNHCFDYFDYFYYFDYFNNLHFSFRWLFFYVLDKALCPYLTKPFGLPLWHPNNAEDLKRLLDAEVEM